MNTIKYSFRFAVMLLAFGMFTGCESTDGGGSVSGGVYYGVGYNDPWYYGGNYDNDDIIVTPPPGQSERPVHPEQPIYNPPAPRPTPMPSIPSMPRPAMRR